MPPQEPFNVNAMNGAPVPFGGVVVAPSSAIHLDIKRQVAQVLEGVEPGETMAVVNVRTGSGVNLAVAHKFNDEWQVDLWVGKSGWDKPIEYGATLSFSR
jgi:hypothetical protein